MKFAKKLVLVPSERYEQMQNLLLNKDSEKVLGIPQQQQLGGSEAGPATSGSHTVPEHGGKGGSEEPETISTSDGPLPREPSTNLRTLDDKQIVDSVGKKFRSKTANLLSYVKRVKPEEMTWNNKGEISYKGNVIAGSNIIDLIRSVMHNVPPSLNVPGSAAFEKILHELNVPITLIGNNNWRSKLHQLKAGRSEQVAEGKVIGGVGGSKQQGKGIVKKKSNTPKQRSVKWISL